MYISHMAVSGYVTLGKLDNHLHLLTYTAFYICFTLGKGMNPIILPPAMGK